MERPSKRCSGKREDAGLRRWRSICNVEKVGGTQGRMDRQGEAGRGGERPSGMPGSSRAAGGSGCPGGGGGRAGRACREAWGAAGRGGARGHPWWTALSGGPWGPPLGGTPLPPSPTSEAKVAVGKEASAYRLRCCSQCSLHALFPTAPEREG